jgi:putative ABC transport system permease protein
MFKNYLKIAWRNLWRNKGYSALNIFGLAIGITCASIMLLWVADELSFNSVFLKQDTVYYLPTNQEYEGEWRTFYQSTPGPLAKALKDEVPEIVRAARTYGSELLFTQGDNSLSRFGRYADPDILEIFSLEFEEGPVENALNRPDAIIINQQLAEDLFGKNVNALNKVVQINSTDNYTITGVMKTLPNNVSFGFEWLVPMEPFLVGEDMAWAKEYGNNFADTFVELSPEANFKTTDAKVRAFLPSKMEDSKDYAFLHTIKDWHLRSNFKDGKQEGGNIVFVRLMGLVAMIILLIACINFMNLSTARSEKRANEVGVRKVLGSGKKSLVHQFMAEAIMTAFLAGTVSTILVTLLLPHYNMLIGKQLSLNLLNSYHGVYLLGIILVCGLLAGWYPAFYLSSFKPVDVLKGARRTQGSASFIRKGLVVSQFAISITFIISTIIIYQQIEYVKNRDLGFAKDHLLQLSVTGDMIKNFDAIQNDLIETGKVTHLGLSNSNMLSDGNNGSGLKWQGVTDTEDVLISFRYVSTEFFKTLGLEIIEGRGFSPNVASDSTNTLVTESFAKLMGTGSAIGKIINRYEDNYTVIGVVKDYVYGNMYGSSDPVMFFHNKQYASKLYIKTIKESNLTETLASIKGVLKTHNPAFPFDYQFVDDAFDSKFRSEQLVGRLSLLFALLAILISCMGLFGLAAYTAERRKKEIGVRKVLGSTVSGIVSLLSKDFMGLVLISLLIAGPLAWWAMKNWLEGFAYRIEIDVWVFIIAGVVAIGIALLTVSFQAVKAAIANPVKSLRTE